MTVIHGKLLIGLTRCDDRSVQDHCWIAAYDTATGKILWDFDDVQTWDAVNGVKAYGGNLDGAAQTVADGTLFVNSGNAMLGSPRHGDAVLAITVDGK